MNKYQIKDWGEHFENNKSKERDQCSWCPIKNKQDGLGYGRLLRMQDGAALYGAFVAVVLMASKQKRPRYGHLTDTGRASDRPLTPDDISIKTQIPSEIIELMLSATCDESVGWMSVSEVICDEKDQSARRVPAECPPSALEGKGREGIEEKEEKPPAVYHEHARVALHFLNEKAGVHYREADSHLSLISQRLKEEGVDIDGVQKMIERQCALWKGQKMQEYLRPSTLFRKSKFDEYYANREQPIIHETDRTTGRPRYDGNEGTYNKGNTEQYANAGSRSAGRPL